MQSFAGFAKGGVDGNHSFPGNDFKPLFRWPGHALMAFRLFKIGFDALEGGDTFAFEVAFTCPRQNWFGKKTMLHAQALFDGFFQKFVFCSTHANNVVNLARNRNSEKFAQNLRIAQTCFRP